MSQMIRSPQERTERGVHAVGVMISTLLRSWLAAWATRDDRGASLVEYVLLVALIAIVCFAAVAFLGTSLDAEYSRVGSELP
jgi:pilus assembly protein Flp/PilA